MGDKFLTLEKYVNLNYLVSCDFCILSAPDPEIVSYSWHPACELADYACLHAPCWRLNDQCAPAGLPQDLEEA